MGYTEAENPSHMGMIMSGTSGMVVGSFQSKKLAPTAGEYLTALEAAMFGGGSAPMPPGPPGMGGMGGQGLKPSQLAVDEKSAVSRLELVLGPAGINAGYYPPPSDEELVSMGVEAAR